jgi:RNA polymerase sigma-70 factor (ECF subfamily)
MATTRPITQEELLDNMGWVRSLAAALVRDPAELDDVVQDTWITALERPPRRTTGPALRAWLAAVVRTLARQSVRRERRRRSRERAAARPEAEPSTADVLVRAALHRRIVDAVMALEEPYRSTVLLRYLDGASAPRIAELQSVSPAAVRKRLSRGLAQLRERLDAEHGGERVAWCGLALGSRDISGVENLGPVFAPLATQGGQIMARAALASTAVKIGALAALLVGLGYSVWRALPDAVPAPPSAAPSPPAVVMGAPAASAEQAVATARAPAGEAPTEELRDSDAERPPAPEAASAQGPRLALFVDSVAQSFLSESPDLPGFDRAVRMLADAAEIDPESVRVDPEDGSIRGLLAVPGSEMQCRFQIAGSRYRIELEPYPGRDLDPPFVMRNVRFSFLAEAGRASDVSAGVQYHPDTRQPASKHLAGDQEQLVGWGVGMGPDGAVAKPLTMKAGPEGVGWTIGHTTRFSLLEEPWATDTSAYDLWLAKLRPYAR